MQGCLALGVSLALVVVAAPPANASSARVPADYFGTNLQNPYSMQAEIRDRHVAAIAATGMTQVRLPIPWSMIEPEPPRAGVHSYSWAKVDDQIQALANQGLQAQALFAYAPQWASNATAWEAQQCRENGAAGLASGWPAGYAAASRALAARYGPGGTFWADHPGLDPRPIRLYEIWNAPNTSGSWCPKVDPEGYAHMFVLAAERIRAVVPGAEVVVGGFGLGGPTQGGSVATDEFMRRMMAAEPSIRTVADAVGAHVYPGPRPEAQLYPLRTLRAWMRAAGIPDSTPMLLNEVGFTRVGAIAMTEPERTASYANITSQLPRVNCNVSGVINYTWTTSERDGSNPEDWFGVANPGTAELYASGQEYVRWTQIFRGEQPVPAPRSSIDLCPGMPPVDQDNDGTPDENDEFPLNPDRDGSGDDGGGDSGGDRNFDCSKRMVSLTRKIANSDGAAKRRYERKYLRTQRQCVPCKRKLARIKRKLKSSDGARERELESRYRRIRRNCAPCIDRLHELELAALSASEPELAIILRKHARVRRGCTGKR